MYSTRSGVRFGATVPTVPDDNDDAERRKKKDAVLDYGPRNIFEAMYYDPSVPGSFGGINALYRSMRDSSNKRSLNEIREWFESQKAYNLHKPSRKRFRRNVILVHGVDEQFQADLADMSMLSWYNNNIHFLLVCIDVFSKYAWVVPLKNKTAPAVLDGFRQIFAERKPAKLQSDHGTEFTNILLREYIKREGVHQFFTWNSAIKAAIAERFIRTIKEKLWRYMTYKKTYRYIDVLQPLVHAYNNTYHRSIKMTPTEASRPENTKQVWQNLYAHTSVVRKIPPSRIKFKYRLGDHVRISEEHDVFRKGYKQRWSKEVYRVIKQSPRDPVVYKLEDLQGEPLVGSFYEPELQKVVAPETWEIEEVLKSRQRRRPRGAHSLEYYVKFRGYPDYDNRWVRSEDITTTTTTDQPQP